MLCIYYSSFFLNKNNTRKKVITNMEAIAIIIEIRDTIFITVNHVGRGVEISGLVIFFHIIIVSDVTKNTAIEMIRVMVERVNILLKGMLRPVSPFS